MDDCATSNAITDVIIETNRRRHVSFLLSKQVWLSSIKNASTISQHFLALGYLHNVVMDVKHVTIQ